MKNFQFIIIPLLLVIFSLKSSAADKPPSIVGIWMMQERNLSDRTYKKIDKFLIGKRCIQFIEDGTFINRVNAGRCGTPPLSYNYEGGTWETLANGSIKITYSNWQGPVSEIFTVKKLEKHQLVLSFE